MNKSDREKEINHQRKREKKELKRNGKPYRGTDSTIDKVIKFQSKVDDRIIETDRFELHDFLNTNIEKSRNVNTNTQIKIPKVFSLEFNYEESIDKLTELRFSLRKLFGRRFEIDFTTCDKIDFAILFLLKVLLEEYLDKLRKLDRKVSRSIYPDIKIRHSKNEKVNHKLFANKIISRVKSLKGDFVPLLAIDLEKGRKSQMKFSENKKGAAVSNIRDFINKGCLDRYKTELSDTGVGFLDNLISEILNNAEDHSKFNTWYAYGNFFETTSKKKNQETIGEINLGIMNFGYSIYDGFEETKEKNIDTYSEMETLYEIVSKKKGGQRFTKDNLISLYALQDGKSRLKYKSESRGTGTMTFINSFLSLGDYESKEKGFYPRLLIFSGFTMIKCDNKYKPFNCDGADFLSLNKENSLTLPPEASHLKSLKNKFPGTLLVVKIYLNENHLKQKIKQNGN